MICSLLLQDVCISSVTHKSLPRSHYIEKKKSLFFFPLEKKMDQKGKKDEQISKAEEEKEEESFAGMENKEKEIETRDMSMEEDTLGEEEEQGDGEKDKPEESMEKEGNSFDGMENKEKEIEARDMSMEEDTLREEEEEGDGETGKPEESMEKEGNGFDGMKINEKRNEIKIMEEDEEREGEILDAMENKEKRIETTSVKKDTHREEEQAEPEESKEKERNGFDGMKINEKRKEIKMMKEDIAEEGEREKDKREESDSFAQIEEEENEMDKKGAQSEKDRKEDEKNVETEEEKDEEDDSSIVTIPSWIFEDANSQQDDVTRGASRSSSTEVKMESPRCRCCSSWHPWFFIGLGWLPIMVGLLLCLSIVIPYCIAVGLKHVSPGFPYISDSGTLPPESCIFGQLLNMAAGLGFAGIYVRYKQVEFLSEDYGSRRKRMLQVNKIGLMVGATASFGMSVVANFQIGNVKSIHFTGAFLLFAPGAMYGFFQSWLSYKMHPQHASILVCHIRLFLSVIIALFFASCMIFTLLAQELTTVKKLNLFWVLADGGYAEHIVATVSEWVVAIAFLLYFFH
ncbi:neurofilament medium polypeptide isoform X2 [Strongylocentrotus purpuratus]|uniref:CWH43-like N-terminal domain-containing protein n=1 Tax=Strongylocentrotus purpuratus TaxID=7668 RepID=A0A7M7P238_STRPU|nr:neurofilament medium polypeptide isoform X2 [Strongylocentrotus purpuratus]